MYAARSDIGVSYPKNSLPFRTNSLQWKIVQRVLYSIHRGKNDSVAETSCTVFMRLLLDLRAKYAPKFISGIFGIG